MTALLADPTTPPRPDLPALVLVHPGALPVGHYRDLAERLTPVADVAVLDLERAPAYFQAALTGAAPDTSIDALAALAATELRATRRLDRPWVLAGWSFGGVVAHALLDQLTPPEHPRRLVLLDSIAPVPGYTQQDDDLSAELVLRWFAMYLAAKRDRPVPVSATPDLAELLTAGLASGALRPGTTLPGLRKVHQAYLAGLVRNNRLARAHTPRRTTRPTTLVRPERGLLATPDPLGWTALTTDLTALDCPGDHYSMLRDPSAVPELAALVASELTAALADG